MNEKEYAELCEKALDNDIRTIDLLLCEVTKAQTSLTAVHELLCALRVGGEDGELPLQDHTDAVHELLIARRALRHLARIGESHDATLAALQGLTGLAAEASQAEQNGGTP